MTKTISTNKSPFKKITLKIFLILIGALVLLIIGYFVSIPLFDKFNHDRFIALNTQMQTIFQSLKTASNGVDEWKYVTSCSAEMAGDWQTGQYYCSVIISSEKTTTSINDVNNLQAKYYPIINNSNTLNNITELDPELPNDFGKKFVVSSAFKRYSETKSGIECDYSIDLYQSVSDKSKPYEENVSYGSAINNDIGNIRISLNCTEKARSGWYLLTK